jgi:ankyrin repeat protein
VDLHSTQTTGTTRSSGRDSDDDLHTDIAKAALETGTKAFDAREWDEASSLLEEALVVLEQLMPHQRNFCDLLSLQYRLSICTYYTHEPEQAEEALLDLVKQSTSTEQQQEYVLSARHLLAQIHIRNGELERARSECETALQGRRRLRGKHSDASLESLALMAHIYVLLNKRALAKSCLAMIPEKRRDAVLAAVEESLGPAVEHLDFASLLTPLMPGEAPNPAAETQSICSGVSGSTVGLGMDKTIFDYGSAGANSPAASPRPSTPSLASPESPRPLLHSHVMVPSSLRNINEPTCIGKERPVEQSVTVSNQDITLASSTNTSPQIAQIRRTDPASRKAILEKMGCQPRDRIEEAVCAGDHVALVYLLNKKKGFWRSSLRKRGRPERVTALHFAALFGEIDVARRLLDASYNVNEVPFGYSTNLTPLNFAVGARQADMVDFLIANGARPAELESWSTLAGQLLSRSWLAKTMCDAEKDLASTRITATMSILLKHGWNVTEPIDQSGKTVLHQAVSFWTGEYRWDMDLRTTVTRFLCERGTNPFQADAEGKTPYDLALASGHQDLLGILEQEPRRRELLGGMELVELPERPHRMYNYELIS